MSRPAALIVSPQAIAKQIRVKLGEGDNVPFEDKIILGHLFGGACDWYLTEYDKEIDMGFGFCHLGDDQCAEWGYVHVGEIREVNKSIHWQRRIEWDRYWSPKKATQIEKIVRCGGC